MAITGGLTLTGTTGMFLRGAASGLSVRSEGAYVGKFVIMLDDRLLFLY